MTDRFLIGVKLSFSSWRGVTKDSRFKVIQVISRYVAHEKNEKCRSGRLAESVIPFCGFFCKVNKMDYSRYEPRRSTRFRSGVGTTRVLRTART